MASSVKKGESIFIPFKNGYSICDSQLRPRMYKTVRAFEKSFPKLDYGTDGIELVEYVPVVHGSWYHGECSVCKGICIEYKPPYCPFCGAKMDVDSPTDKKEQEN